VLDARQRKLLSVSAQRVEDLTVTLLAAEAAGLARWTLNTATEYAKVREQFGKPIGSFQASSTCAPRCCFAPSRSRLAASDAAAAVANQDERQLSVAAAVAAATAIDSAKAQREGLHPGARRIGITFEHDAHLYLRRAYGIAQFLGGRSRWLRRVAALTKQGVRSRPAHRS